VIVKFVKGTVVFLVLCLAAYGTYTLFNKSPNLDVCESDFAYLEALGIHIQDGQVADSGLSGILGDVEGVPAIGATGSTSFGGGSSAPPSFLGNSAPPSFMTEPTTSSTPPPFMDAPRVAVANHEPQTTPDFFQPTVEPLLPLNFSEPANFPIPAPPFEASPPLEASPFEARSFDAPPISAAESPPPWTESWDGPASHIPVMPPPEELLHSHNSPTVLPNPIANTLADALSPIHERVANPPIGGNIRRIENVRGIEADSPPIPASVPVDQKQAFSSSVNVPLEVGSISSTRYTRTSSRQPLAFEPVRPEVSPTAPMVAFAPPRPLNQPPQFDQPPEPPRQIEAASPVVISPAAVSPDARQIGVPRLIEHSDVPPVAQPSVQPAIRETIERFIQSQRQLAESGDPDNIRQAFVHLSQLYELDELGDAERAMMQPILDVLALRVIYARETHILEPPHQVKPGETVESIARDFNLTPALLRKINGLAMSQELPAGTVLKVLYGQFDARISIQRRELTLLLGGLYAGRFSFSLPTENISVRRGEFYVTNRTDRVLVLNNGWVLAADNVREATIAFADRDARKILDILSEKSVIVVE